ncbi:tRNA (adenosine(37)-N6)-threonylcarbamoyltransferase complex dimerization subunit type 1 TsaB [Zhongshania sp.]|uniref:tRNA (adenosine(37)-N6)-threonylcarbamoyltransferase complex dimerization subunit type 1 TsaB n=1 Tax=Zhongshania sp. TaxID=1971902 RepID=UPI003566EB4F
MSSLLAIEASTEACSVALLHQGREIEDFRMLPRAHTQFILPMVAQILAEADLSLSQIDAIGFAAGPGSFTGLRVCAGVVQGLAFSQNIPVVAVSTLQALAQDAAVNRQISDGDIVLAALDARMDEIYWGQYQIVSGFAEATTPDSLRTPESIKAMPEGGQIVGIGSGWVYQSRFSLSRTMDVVDVEVYPRASAVLRLANRELLAGRYTTAELAQPVYLRDSVAWQKS